MASEDIGALYNTQIPGYDDAADIQAALRLYHYGSSSYDINNANTALIEPDSIAGAFNAIDTRINTLETQTVPAQVSSTEPTSPVEGYLWLDTSASTSNGVFGMVADYQEIAPTTYLSHGRIWVKSGVTPLEMYVYNSSTASWDRII